MFTNNFSSGGSEPAAPLVCPSSMEPRAKLKTSPIGMVERPPTQPNLARASTSTLARFSLSERLLHAASLPVGDSAVTKEQPLTIHKAKRSVHPFVRGGVSLARSISTGDFHRGQAHSTMLTSVQSSAAFVMSQPGPPLRGWMSTAELGPGRAGVAVPPRLVATADLSVASLRLDGNRYRVTPDSKHRRPFLFAAAQTTPYVVSPPLQTLEMSKSLQPLAVSRPLLLQAAALPAPPRTAGARAAGARDGALSPLVSPAKLVRRLPSRAGGFNTQLPQLTGSPPPSVSSSRILHDHKWRW